MKRTSTVYECSVRFTSCEQSEYSMAATPPLHVCKANTSLKICQYSAIIYIEVISVRNDKLSVQSMEFAVSIINLVKVLKEKRETIISNQIGRSGTSIGANIREAQYAHGRADFIAKLQIALKEANETGYWIELLYRTNYITQQEYQSLETACTSIRAMLVSSINTAKQNKDT